MSGEGNEGDEVEGWGREAIKAVGDADFQWRRRTSAAKSAQAAAAPAALRCLGEAVCISRTACQVKSIVRCIEIAAIEPHFHCMLVVFKFVVTPSLFAISRISREHPSALL